MLLLAVIVLCGVCGGGPARAADLSRYVRYHEMLTYAPVRLPAAAGRSRRSATAPVRLTVRALGRQLPLQLAVDTSVFAPDASYSGPSGSGWPASAAAYRGSVHGQPGSLVLGTLVDGLFAGTIRLADDTLFVERAALHVDGGPEPHSFIYRQRDIVLPGPARGFRACGVGQQQHWDVPATVTGANTSNDTRLRRNANDDDGLESRGLFPSLHSPSSRQVSPNEKTQCNMYIETDPRLWQYAFEKQRGSVSRTEAYLVSSIANYIQAVNEIYSNASFDGRQTHRGFSFRVQYLKIADDSTCLSNYKGKRSRICFTYTNSQYYLNAHSHKNFDAFCLAYAFTYHDFENGVMGLAYVGMPWLKRGVCSRYRKRRLRNPATGAVSETWNTLNTGIVSLRNWGVRVHPLISQLTLAHEIGHNMGSPHDQGKLGSECLPNDANGNYMMFYLSQTGLQERNSLFSKCSIGNISRVLDFITLGHASNCFKPPGAAFCGNYLIEKGEQCDCGISWQDCTDRCCYPRTPSWLKTSRRYGCRLRPGAQCSPDQGPCCDAVSCQLVTTAVNVTCSAAGDCSLPAVCDGRSPRCPAPLPKANHTLCQGGVRVCLSGRCAGSICLERGMYPCELSAQEVGGDRARMCHAGCRGPGSAICEEVRQVSLLRGARCNVGLGVCDELLRCRPVQQLGPVEHLQSLLSAGAQSASGQPRQLRWWAVLLLVLLLAVVCALLLRCLALHIPSSNPRKPPARALADTMQAPIATFFGLTGGGDLQL